MSLSISSVSYAEWRGMLPPLQQLGLIEPDRDYEGYQSPDQLPASDTSERWLLVYVRPELAVAQALSAGKSAVTALAQWEFEAGLLLEHYRQHRDRSALVDAEAARANSSRLSLLLAEHWDLSEPEQGDVQESETRWQDFDSASGISQVALLLASQLVAQTSSVRPLLTQMAAFSVSIPGYVDQKPSVDVVSLQAALQSQIEPGAEFERPASSPEAPQWLLRQLFDAQEQLNRYYLREETAQEELEKAQNAISQLQNQNAELKKQLTSQRQAAGSGLASQGHVQLLRRAKSALGGGLARHYRLKQQAALVRSSELFDEAWYLAQNPDVRKTGMNPAWHFVVHGGQEGRAPSPRFDCARYLSLNPDVAQQGVNPLVHYLTQGKAEGRPV